MSMGNLLFKFLWIVLLCSFEGSARRKWWLSKPESPVVKKLRATCLHNNAHMRCLPRDIDCSERSIQVTFRPTSPAFLEQNSGLRTFPDISYWTSIRQDFEGRERERGRKRKNQLAASILWINLSQVSDLPPLQWLLQNCTHFLKNRYPLVLSRRTKGTN